MICFLIIIIFSSTCNFLSICSYDILYICTVLCYPSKQYNFFFLCSLSPPLYLFTVASNLVSCFFDRRLLIWMIIQFFSFPFYCTSALRPLIIRCPIPPFAALIQAESTKFPYDTIKMDVMAFLSQKLFHFKYDNIFGLEQFMNVIV